MKVDNTRSTLEIFATAYFEAIQNIKEEPEKAKLNFGTEVKEVEEMYQWMPVFTNVVQSNQRVNSMKRGKFGSYCY